MALPRTLDVSQRKVAQLKNGAYTVVSMNQSTFNTMINRMFFHFQLSERALSFIPETGKPLCAGHAA